MLTKEKILTMITDLESETVERTRAFDKMDKMGQAISAFANDLPGRKTPGYLLLGVEDNGTISGRRIKDDQLTALGGLKTEGALLPQPSIAIEKFSFPEGDVVAIEVFPAKYPPILFKGQAWVRVGARKALASQLDLQRFEERCQHSTKRFEELPCMDAKLEDLDLFLFQTQYLPKAVSADIIDDDRRPVEEQLASLRFYDLETKTPTNMGILLFGKRPDFFIPSAYIQYVKFAGEDNGADIVTDHAYKGPLLKVITDLNAFVKVGVACPHSVKVTCLQERTYYKYPDWTVRELLLNSIIHKDYAIGNAPTKFYEYEGHRLEIVNAGGLYGLANRQNFPRINDYRNPKLAEAIKIMGFVNKYNRGISKVKEELAKNGNPPPIFDVDDHIFKVTLHSTTDEITPEIIRDTMFPLGEPTMEFHFTDDNQGDCRPDKRNQEAVIVDLIARNPGINKIRLSSMTHIPVRTLARILAKMTENPDTAQIIRRGANKNGGWYRKY